MYVSDVRNNTDLCYLKWTLWRVRTNDTAPYSKQNNTKQIKTEQKFKQKKKKKPVFKHHIW